MKKLLMVLSCAGILTVAVPLSVMAATDDGAKEDVESSKDCPHAKGNGNGQNCGHGDCSERGGGGGGCGMGCGGGGEMAGGKLLNMPVEALKGKLDLTDEQVAKITAIRDSFAKETEAAKAELKQLGEEFRTNMHSGDMPNRDEALAKYRQMHALRGEIGEASLKARLDTLEVFTDAQRKALQEKMKACMHGKGEKAGKKLDCKHGKGEAAADKMGDGECHKADLASKKADVASKKADVAGKGQGKGNKDKAKDKGKGKGLKK